MLATLRQPAHQQASPQTNQRTTLSSGNRPSILNALHSPPSNCRQSDVLVLACACEGSTSHKHSIIQRNDGLVASVSATSPVSPPRRRASHATREAPPREAPHDSSDPRDVTPTSPVSPPRRRASHATREAPPREAPHDSSDPRDVTPTTPASPPRRRASHATHTFPSLFRSPAQPHVPLASPRRHRASRSATTTAHSAPSPPRPCAGSSRGSAPWYAPRRGPPRAPRDLTRLMIPIPHCGPRRAPRATPAWLAAPRAAPQQASSPTCVSLRSQHDIQVFDIITSPTDSHINPMCFRAPPAPHNSWNTSSEVLSDPAKRANTTAHDGMKRVGKGGSALVRR